MAAGRRVGLDLVAAASAFLVPVAYLPIVDGPFWSPKAAVLLPAAAAGLTQLPSLLRSPLRRAALAAIAFLVAAVLSTVLSDDVSQAVFGLYNAGTGLIFVGVLVGCWALGASVTDSGRQRVVLGLLAGIAVSGAVGVLQVVVDVGVPTLALPEDGRASGLAGNAVHLAALAVGAVGLAAMKVPERRSWLLGVGCGAAVIQVTGTRVALVLLLPLLLMVVVRRGVRSGGAVLVALLLGLAAGSSVGAVGDQGISTTGRVTASAAAGGGVTARVEAWRSAGNAASERPLLGAGPGRFRAATSPHRTLALARAEGPDRLFEDGHNLVVEYTVTTGVLGLGALSAWLFLCAGAVRIAPLASFGAVVIALHLVQPQSVGTTPLAFLALGAATGGVTHRSPVPRAAPVVVWAAAVVAGASLGGVLLFGDAQLQRARLDFDGEAAHSALTVLRPWPNPATIRARMSAFDSLSDRTGSADAEVLTWRREAISRDATSPRLWSDLAADELTQGEPTAALGHYLQALELDPWSVRAARGIVLSAPLSDRPQQGDLGRKVLSQVDR